MGNERQEDNQTEKTVFVSIPPKNAKKITLKLDNKVSSSKFLNNII